jgi:hypothetical protein
MTRLNLVFAEAPPAPKAWPRTRVLVWTLLFASLWVWVAASLH